MGSQGTGDAEPQDAGNAEIFHLAMPATPGAVVLARRQLTRFLRLLHLPERAIGDLSVAVGEALSNSVEHGARNGGKVELRAHLTRDGVEVHVTDDGAGFDPRPRPVEPPGGAAPPRGFGIYLMYSLMDEVEYNERGTSVRLFKRTAPDQPSGSD